MHPQPLPRTAQVIFHLCIYFFPTTTMEQERHFQETPPEIRQEALERQQEEQAAAQRCEERVSKKIDEERGGVRETLIPQPAIAI